MNYYPHHIGDYRRNTSHLSLLEHGVYRQLLDTYYLSEQPIPTDTVTVFRKLSARTDEERKAVETILNEFFVLTEAGWIQERCHREIKAYQSKVDAAKENGKLGGRPKQTKAVISGLSGETKEKANREPGTSNQEPKTILQKPLKRVGKHTEGMRSAEVFEKDQTCVDPQPVMRTVLQRGTAESCCKTMAKQGIQGCNPHHPTLIALLEAGASEQEFVHAAMNASAKGKMKFDYVIGIVKRQREEAAKLVLHRGQRTTAQEAVEATNRAATAAWMPAEMRERNHAS